MQREVVVAPQAASREVGSVECTVARMAVLGETAGGWVGVRVAAAWAKEAQPAAAWAAAGASREVAAATATEILFSRRADPLVEGHAAPVSSE